MMKFSKMMHRGEKGFTLVELLIVMVIIGILAMIAIPALNTARRNSQNRTCRSNMQTIANAINQYYADNDLALPTTDTPVSLTQPILDYLKGGRAPRDPHGNTAYTTSQISGEAITITCPNGSGVVYSE